MLISEITLSKRLYRNLYLHHVIQSSYSTLCTTWKHAIWRDLYIFSRCNVLMSNLMRAQKNCKTRVTDSFGNLYLKKTYQCVLHMLHKNVLALHVSELHYHIQEIFHLITIKYPTYFSSEDVNLSICMWVYVRTFFLLFA